MLDKLHADQNFAFETRKVNATPTLFVNGEKLVGSPTFEELDRKIEASLKP